MNALPETIMKEFSEDGLSLSYPDDWQIEREATAEGWTVTLQSPGTAFAVLRLERDLERTTEELVGGTLEALQEDYPSLEAESGMDMLAGELAIGHNIQFFSLDLVITCWTRSFYAAAGAVLVLCQVSDVDRETYEPALRAICASLRAEVD
jgi:hypothetical protein